MRERPFNPTPVRVVGIDPAARTGIVLVNVPAGVWRGGEPVDVTRLELLGTESISRMSKDAAVERGMTNAERDFTLYQKMWDTLNAWMPDVVVIEEPADQGFGPQGRGVSFGIGKAYGFAIIAAMDGENLYNPPRVHSYLVGGWKAKKNRDARPGWMPKEKAKSGLWHTMKSEDVEAIFRDVASRMIDLRTDQRELSKDEVMALGVLCFHLSR